MNEMVCVCVFVYDCVFVCVKNKIVSLIKSHGPPVQQHFKNGVHVSRTKFYSQTKRTRSSSQREQLDVEDECADLDQVTNRTKIEKQKKTKFSGFLRKYR